MSLVAALAFVLLSAAACGGDEQDPAADVGEMSCSSTTLIVTPRVQARPDGVHLEVSVTQEHGVSASIDGQRVRGGVVLQLSPGDHRVRCSHADGGSLESPFEVVEADAQP